MQIIVKRFAELLIKLLFKHFIKFRCLYESSLLLLNRKYHSNEYYLVMQISGPINIGLCKLMLIGFGLFGPLQLSVCFLAVFS